MSLDTEIVELTSRLYSNLSFANSDIQFIIDTIRLFIKDKYNPFLLKQLESGVLKVLQEDVVNDIKSIFKKQSDPFFKFRSHDTRLTLYKNMSMFIEPITCTLQNLPLNKIRQDDLTIKTKHVYTKHMPLTHSLVQLLQIENLFDATVAYMNALKSESHVLSNFIQGTTWKEQMKHFTQNDGIALPLVGYFDEIETGNPLGSRSGNNNLGGFYVYIPCLPPNFSSKLNCILVSDLFYSADKKKVGNEAIFNKVIEELNYLRQHGIIIMVNNRPQKVYFLTSLITGDNLGLNSIFGFTCSFSQTVCCRICYATADQWKIMARENINLLRTKEKYAIDIAQKNTKETGVREECVFNKLVNFNAIENCYGDIMHELMEGVNNYVMTKVVLHFIGSKKFKIDFLNGVMHTMDFCYENNNIPNAIKLNYVTSNGKLKMSASEMLFFTRYFGLMIGEKIDDNDQLSDEWLLYTNLREIVSILTSPNITDQMLEELVLYIEEHNALYIKLYGSLTVKFHMLLHYVRLIKKNGPPIKVCTLRCESKHRIIKEIVQATSSRKNVLSTAANRYQLSLINLKYQKYETIFINYGKEIEDASISSYFPECKNKKTFNKVIINDIIYKQGTIITINVDQILPGMGEICKIFLVDKIYFEYIPFKVYGFNEVYFAYSVEYDNLKKIVCYDLLQSRLLGIICEKKTKFT